ncbi:DUF5719 family protein [Bifidobacterium scaligerum]|uniref:Organic solvents resistance ABC transporter permease n=1 Tax=Bifidobacterium scaligerum TaxID=2052656 RepID=A0A2M9HQR5_9BIFI|nr:DUF5719 family protein [Bifidobacterium scaligerum]PJM79148.1 hypothetical protein CUU80_03540 [Bifidobacterium scaligerum]
MSRGNATRRSRRSRVYTAVLGAITMLVLLASFAALMILPVPIAWVDTVRAKNNALGQSVSTTQIESYCPAPMQLADTGTYGDSAFQATAGNLSTQERFAAFGSVYSATVAPFGTANASDTSITLKDGDPSDDADVKIGTQSNAQSDSLIDTHMLQAAQGTGTAGTVVSWADEGDLKGVSAASCTATALSRSFLLTGTGTGTTQQLVVVNPSAKATTVDIMAWGSEQAGKMALSTQSTVSVPAKGETSVDLSAAAEKQNGLYVTVSSKETPLAAMVRTVSMDGLTSQGSDFAVPLAAESDTAAVPAIASGDAVTAYLFAHEQTKTTLSWVTNHGLVSAKNVEVEAGKVQIVDLGKAPDGALGVLSTAEDALSFSVRAVRSGENGQADFALGQAAEPAAYSGLALANDVDADVTLVNVTNVKQTVTITAYDETGKEIDDRDITLDANSAWSDAVGDLSQHDTVAALRLEDKSGAVAWGVRLGHDGLGDGTVAGLAMVNASSLMPSTAYVWARANDAIVR